MLKYLLSFFQPKEYYDLYLSYDEVIPEHVAVNILSYELEIDSAMSEYIYNIVKNCGQWCIASDTNKKKIELLQHSLWNKGLNTYIEVN